MKLLWGIDLGGTKIECAVLDPSRPENVLCRERIATEAEKGYEHIVSQVARLIGRAAEKLKVSPQSVGIGHPGVVDPATGLLKNSNTTCLNGMPLKADLEKTFGFPVEMSNDANCFALAEAALGAAKGKHVVFGVIMGTGVGGGIVVNGKALYGQQGIAGEWGHNILNPDGEQCYCGKRGCVETVISGPALEKYYQRLSGKELALEVIVKLWRERNDAAAGETIGHLCSSFGRAIACIINILDPNIIVLGGGVSNIGELYTDGVEAAKKFVFNNRFETPIVRHVLGDSAGVFGAALLGGCNKNCVSVDSLKHEAGTPRIGQSPGG